MIEEKARVVELKDNGVVVESVVKSACSHCEQVDNCGSGQISKAIPSKRLTVTLSTELPVSVGDDVLLGLSEKHLLSTAWQVYLYPLFGLMLFGFLGQYAIKVGIFTAEPIAILMSFLGGYLGFLWARYQQKKPKCSELNVTILKILSKS